MYSEPKSLGKDVWFYSGVSFASVSALPCYVFLSICSYLLFFLCTSVFLAYGITRIVSSLNFFWKNTWVCMRRLSNKIKLIDTIVTKVKIRDSSSVGNKSWNFNGVQKYTTCICLFIYLLLWQLWFIILKIILSLTGKSFLNIPLCFTRSNVVF